MMILKIAVIITRANFGASVVCIWTKACETVDLFVIVSYDHSAVLQIGTRSSIG